MRIHDRHDCSRELQAYEESSPRNFSSPTNMPDEHTSRKMSRAKRERKRSGKKQKLEGEDGLVDRISALPDDIVIGIVSLLPLKDAAATCVLSRRWEHVWKFSASLDFDEDDQLFARFHGLEPDEMDPESRRYIDRVDSVIGKHRASTIERFRVCFDLDFHFTKSVDSWVEFAMNKRVQELELEFRSVYILSGVRGPNWINRNYMYQFPPKLLGLEMESGLQLKHLDSSCSIGFSFLRVLRFTNVDVSQEVLERFLYNCPVLERLSVKSTRSLVGLRVAGPSIALKYLELLSCDGLNSIQISDTNLVSLTFSQGAEISLLLISNAPSLVEVSYKTSRSMDLPRFLTQISRCTHLEMLMLNISVMDYDSSLVFPHFANLKHLELTVEQDSERGLQYLLSFLEASPYLEKLVLKLERYVTREYYKVIGNVKKMAHCPHYHLKVVKIENYRGRSCAKHVMYLIHNAAALEKIVIKPICNLGSQIVNSERQEALARNHAMQCLKRKVPSSIEFVCM
ncbi:hypothetical protein ACLB2K_061219 [Fragaria x ananassa]